MNTATRWIIAIIVIIAIVAIGGYLSHHAPSSGQPALDAANATYSFMGDTFALSDGSATIQGHSGLGGAIADDTLVPMGYTLAATTTGDVDGDGSPDTVAALYRGFGANLEWVTLFAFSADGTQIASGTAYTYDSKVESVSVANGVVSLNLLVVSDEDMQNLAHYEQVPNQPKTIQFTIADGSFVAVDAGSAASSSVPLQ